MANAALLWASEIPLGHDEAQYTLATSEWLRGEVPRWTYLSVGMTAVAAPGVLAGGGERQLRVASVLCGLALLLVSARLARQIAGATAAAWTVAVIAGTSCIAKRSADLLSDVPATACLLIGTSILLAELARDSDAGTPPGLRWRLLLVAPWLVAAFYLRYGSCLPILVICAVALAGGWRAIRHRPWPLIATVGLGIALLVPHVLMSIAITGTALGILRESSAAVPSELGLRTYVTSNPFTYYGVVAAPLMMVGLGSILRRRDRRSLMIWAIAVGDILVVGLTALAQSRYILLGITLLLILGVRELEHVAAARTPRARTWLLALAGIAIATSWALITSWAVRIDDKRRFDFRTTAAAVAVIKRDAAGRPCIVVGRRLTQLEWYSGCYAALDASISDLAQRRVYVVVESGPYQPRLAELPGRQQRMLEQPGVVVTRLDPD
jgi:4-amino-4-deoxy-L-arabinose transferase-like glycosyltransferase